MAHRVSAATLRSIDASTLLQMNHLHHHGKSKWNTDYDEEYYGFYDLPAWISITESEYQKIRHIHGNTLPTMALFTVEYNENGKPVRAR